MKGSIFRWLLLLLTPIVYWGFYWYVGFSNTFVKMSLFLLTSFLLIFLFNNVFIEKFDKDSYSRLFKGIILVIFISILNAFIVWEQEPLLTFRASAGSFCILYYFLLLKLKPTFKDIFTIVSIFIAIYSVLWIIALKSAPRVIFGMGEDINDIRGMYRIVLYSIDILVLFFFITISKFQNSKRIIWALLAMFSFVLIFFNQTRGIIFSVIALSIYAIFFRNKWLMIAFFCLFFFGGNWMISLINKNQIAINLIQLTKSEVEDEGIFASRTPEYTHMFDAYPFNILTALLGNGTPHIDSSYGQREEGLKKSLRFNRSDTGYVDLYVTYGIVGIVLYLMLIIKGIKQKVPQKIMPFKFMLIVILFINITVSGVVMFGIALSISCYVLESARISKKANMPYI